MQKLESRNTASGEGDQCLSPEREHLSLRDSSGKGTE